MFLLQLLLRCHPFCIHCSSIDFLNSKYDFQNTFIHFHKSYSRSLFTQWISIIDLCISCILENYNGYSFIMNDIRKPSNRLWRFIIHIWITICAVFIKFSVIIGIFWIITMMIHHPSTLNEVDCVPSSWEEARYSRTHTIAASVSTKLISPRKCSPPCHETAWKKQFCQLNKYEVSWCCK